MVCAERWVVYMPLPREATMLEALVTQGHIVQDLAPLPWLVLESDVEPILSSRLRQKTPVYRDVLGHFAGELTPNDPLYSEQWHLQEIGVEAFWEKTQGDGVIIAVLDSGIDADHADLQDVVLLEQGYDFGNDDALAYDSLGHGTAMAGLIAANCDNEMGGCGVAPHAQLIPYKLNTENNFGIGLSTFSSVNLAAAILAATASDAQIINMSLVLDDYTPWVEQALLHAYNQGKIVVAAAGNQGREGIAFPAYLTNVVGVAAHTPEQLRMDNSNYGQGLLISAPGVDLWTTRWGADFTNIYSGTSSATAVVSGALALLVAAQPQRDPTQQILTLLEASLDVEPAGFDDETGVGHLRLPIDNVDTNQSDIQIIFTPKQAELVVLPNKVDLSLDLKGVTGQYGDMYLRLHAPVGIGQRTATYFVWNQANAERLPFNQLITTPYYFTQDVNLPLLGSEYAVLGMGILDTEMPLGLYEWLVTLVFDGNTTPLYKRKLVWLRE